MEETDAAVTRVQSRIKETLTRTVKLYCDPSQPQVVHDLLGAFLYVLHKNRLMFLRAAFQNQSVRAAEASYQRGLEQMLVHPPAVWEFQHAYVYGTLTEAFSCADRYHVCKQFIDVHPLKPEDPVIDPLMPMRILMRHKETSPFLIGYLRRMELKRQLGSHRSLVSHARGMTKTEFLEQFAAKPGEEIKLVDRKGRDYTLRRRIPDISSCDLLNRTGYTPEQFWREVHNPRTQQPKYPQLELALGKS